MPFDMFLDIYEEMLKVWIHQSLRVSPTDNLFLNKLEDWLS